MTEQKKLQEQMALHDYWSVTDDASTRKERESVENETNGQRASRTLQRVVTIPTSDPSTAWRTFEQRRRQRQRRVARTARRSSPLVPRTLAQTGTRAVDGRTRALPRPLPHHGSPIPARSGRRPRRRGLLWKILGFSAIGLLVILLGSFVLTGSAFRITQVAVVGTRSEGLERTIQQMGMQGQNIFLLDVTGFSKRIAALPQVASVELSKQLPNHLVVHVQERQPVLLWQTPEKTFAVDREGIVIAPASEVSGGEHLNTIIDLTKRQQTGKQAVPVLRPGMHLNTADVAFAQDIERRLPQVVGISTYKLYYDGTMYTDTTGQGGEGPGSGGLFMIESPDGWKAYLGGAADTNSLDNRLVALREILVLTRQQQLDVATIDLRYGQRPTFTVKQ